VEIEKQPEIYNFITLEEINDVYEMKVLEMGKIYTGMKDCTVKKKIIFVYVHVLREFLF